MTAMRAILPYADHDKDCTSNRMFKHSACDCGFTEVWKRANEELEKCSMKGNNSGET